MDKIGVPPWLVRRLVDNTVRSRATIVAEDKKRAVELGVNLVLGEWHRRPHITDTSKAACDYFDNRNKIKLVEELYSIDYKTFKLAPQNLNCTSQS